MRPSANSVEVRNANNNPVNVYVTIDLLAIISVLLETVH